MVQLDTWLAFHRGDVDPIARDLKRKLEDAAVGLAMLHRRRAVVARTLHEMLSVLGAPFAPYLDGRFEDAPVDAEAELGKAAAIVAVLPPDAREAPQILLEEAALAAAAGDAAGALSRLDRLLTELPGFASPAIAAAKLALESGDVFGAVWRLAAVEPEARSTRVGSAVMADALRKMRRYREAATYDRASLLAMTIFPGRGNDCAPLDASGQPVCDPRMPMPLPLGWGDGVLKTDRGLYHRMPAGQDHEQLADVLLEPGAPGREGPRIADRHERAAIARLQRAKATGRIVGLASPSVGHDVPVRGPFRESNEGWLGTISMPPTTWGGAQLFCTIDGRLVGPVTLPSPDSVLIGEPDLTRAELSSARIRLIAAERQTLSPPFAHVAGFLWINSVHDLAPISDSLADGLRSKVQMFEDGIPLVQAHAPHVDIAALGAGRYSHWESTIFFSTTDGSDPGQNGRRYDLLVTSALDAHERWMGHQLSSGADVALRRVAWLFEEPEGWIGYVPDQPDPGPGESLLLIRDTRLVGPATFVSRDHVRLTGTGADDEAIGSAIHYVAAGTLIDLLPPFRHLAGLGWTCPAPAGAGPHDRVGADRNSRMMLLENDVFLPMPHAAHAEISALGKGRFSHWENDLFFSTLDGSDPNANGKAYRALVARHEA